MMKFLAGVIATTALILAGFFVGQTYFLPAPAKTAAPLAGNFNTTGGGTYNLQATITSSQTTINLSSFTEPQSNIPYTMSYLNSSIEYATIAPQTSQSEFVSFTGITQNSDGSATLTGVQRGLDRSYPYTASSTLALPHAGQSRFILSNPPQVYNSYGALTNANTWSAVNTFGSTTPPTYDADPVWGNFTTQVFADVAYVNSVVAGGAANASETVKGIVQLATAAQAALGTSLGSTAARLAIPNSLATSTPYNSGSNVVPVTGTNEKLSQLFLDLTQGFTFSATTTMATSTVASTTATVANIGTLNVNTFNGQVVNYQDFTSSGTWTKPSTASTSDIVIVEAWGAGGGGGGVQSGTGQGGAGGGGGYVQAQFRMSDLGSTVTVTVGAGGVGTAANGAANVGGNTTFGALLTAYGGGGGLPGAGGPTAGGAGGGGGIFSVGSNGGSGAPGAGGSPLSSATGGTANNFGGGTGGLNAGGVGGASVYGGGGGGFVNSAGGQSFYGGGGGGQGSGVGGISVMGGAGGAGTSGATASNGIQPGGGGGGCASSGTCTGGNGAAGELRIWVIK